MSCLVASERMFWKWLVRLTFVQPGDFVTSTSLRLRSKGIRVGGNVPILQISFDIFCPVVYARHNMRQGSSRTFLSPELSIPGLLGSDANPSATATSGFASRSIALDEGQVCGHSQTGATRHPEVGPKTPAVAPAV